MVHQIRVIMRTNDRSSETHASIQVGVSHDEPPLLIQCHGPWYLAMSYRMFLARLFENLIQISRRTPRFVILHASDLERARKFCLWRQPSRRPRPKIVNACGAPDILVMITVTRLLRLAGTIASSTSPPRGQGKKIKILFRVPESFLYRLSRRMLDEKASGMRKGP